MFFFNFCHVFTFFNVFYFIISTYFTSTSGTTINTLPLRVSQSFYHGSPCTSGLWCDGELKSYGNIEDIHSDWACNCVYLADNVIQLFLRERWIHVWYLCYQHLKIHAHTEKIVNTQTPAFRLSTTFVGTCRLEKLTRKPCYRQETAQCCNSFGWLHVTGATTGHPAQ